MKINRLSVLVATTLEFLALTNIAQTQTIVDFTGAMAPANWTLSSEFSEADFPFDTPTSQSGATALHGPDGSTVQVCNCGVNITEPFNYVTGIGGPLTLRASVTVPFTGQLTFDFEAGVYDARGWGDGVDVFNRVGYTITRSGDEIANVSFTDSFGNATASTPGFQNLPAPPYVIDLEAGDEFSFYLFTAGGSADTAYFSSENFMLTSVPEPGEWVALAGVGLLGFAGVRRWRQARATI